MFNCKYLLVFLFFVSSSIVAASFPDEPYISVTGIASMEVKPDQVIIQFQATVGDKQAEAAKSIVDLQVSDLLRNLEKAGFNPATLESAKLYSRAEYEYQDNKRLLRGIRVTRHLTYRLTDINKVNLFLTAVLDSNIELIDALQYGLQSAEKWQLQVRKMAVQDSKLKAENLAELYQTKLGKIYSIDYMSHQPRPMNNRVMLSESAPSDSYQVQNITINDRVSAVFLLK